MKDGACRQNDPELFHHPSAERGISRSRREMAAKAICNVCPVIEECREYAIEHNESYGTWGGLSESDRKRVLRQNVGYL